MGRQSSRWVNQWEIPSGSSNRTYKVSVDAVGNWACSCPAWGFQRAKLTDGICKHIRAAKMIFSTSNEAANIPDGHDDVAVPRRKKSMAVPKAGQRNLRNVD
jgi:hypothetical protein